MALSSITSVPQSGSFELLSTQLKNPPALTNNSGSTVTVAITATGEWSLIKADFATSDPDLIRYKKLVDADGLPREKRDEKFNLKYPNLNPAALVGEIKDAAGKTKSTVSGKQQSFELQPGDSVSFIINDDEKWYGDNAGKLTLSYSATAKSVQPTQPIEPQSKPEIYTITDLYNTGVDNARQVLGDSVADSHYTLATYPAGTVTPGVTTPNKDLAPINWIANTQTARWIGPNTASATGPVGDYSYKTTFTLPSFSEASIVGQIAVDDRITDILINGVSVGNPVPLSSWTTIQRFSISTGFVVGTNTIEFKLHSIGGPTGLQIDNISGTYKQGLLSTGKKIKLKSWKGDYLHRPDSDQGVTSWSTGVGNEWTVEVIADNKIKLKSWKGDYLHRPDSDQGVTSWSTGVGNEWTVEAIADNKIKLKSWKGDYLHRPDSAQGVTTWSTGIGNEWIVEVIS